MNAFLYIFFVITGEIKMKKLNRIIKMDSYDAVSFFNGLVFFAPVSLLVRTQAGVSQSMFFLLQALLSVITFLGEIPTGFLTDRIGYKRSLVLSQGLLLLARFLLFVSFICKSPVLFSVEAIVEGLSYCFVSGTDSAYVYEVYGTKNYLSKMTHASNCGTAGFLISTVVYVVIYHVFNIEGLLLSTIATSMAAAVFSFKLKKEPSKVIGQKEPQNKTTSYTENDQDNKNMENCHPLKRLFSTMKHPKALLFAVELSVFQVSWLLINFFYVEKLETCGISVEWMSAVILGYSAVEMLAEPIIRKIGNAFSNTWAFVFEVASGIGFLLFGFISHKILVVALMLILPLLLKLPEYFVMEQENVLVDMLGADTQRAAALSLLNMGVSIIEIFALFASAALTAVGISWCFFGVGILLIIAMLCLTATN